MRSTALCAVLLSMAAPALQGCGGLPPGEETNEAAEEAADALLTPAPDLPKPWVDAIDLSEQTELLDFQYVIPPEAAARAPLRDWMTNQAARLKARALKSAEDDFASSQASGFPFRQHSDGTRWAATADTRLLMSFQGQHYFYTGGAHPMVHYLALVYDKPKGTLMRPAGIFADPAAAFAYLTPFYCERLDQLRLEKRGAETDPSELFGDCPKLSQASVIPISKTPKAIDTIRIVLDPYVAGPYAEGEYVVELPVDQSIIDLVKAEYQGVFIGREPLRSEEGSPAPSGSREDKN